MSVGRDDVKQRIEAEYDQCERTVDSGSGHLGQMTIAFCAADCLTDNNCDEELGLE